MGEPGVAAGDADEPDVGGDQAYLHTVATAPPGLLRQGGKGAQREEVEPGGVDDERAPSGSSRLDGLPHLLPPQRQGVGVRLAAGRQDDDVPSAPEAESQLLVG